MDLFKRNWEDLSTDLVYSEGQVKRFRLPPPPPWVERVPMTVPAWVSGTPIRTTFYVHPSLEDRRDFVLRHLAGLSEMRYRLLAPKEAWEVDRNPVHYSPSPDAYVFSRGQRLAVEYDAGYPLVIARKKLLAMGEKYPKQIWGVPTKDRQLTLLQLVPERLLGRVEVILAPWF